MEVSPDGLALSDTQNHHADFARLTSYQLPSTASLTTREGTDEPRYVNKLRNKLPPVTALKFEDTGEVGLCLSLEVPLRADHPSID